MKKPSGITLEQYSEKSFVLRGDTRPYKEDIKKIGGKWAPNLQDGPGWLFSTTRRCSVDNWLSTGEIDAIQYVGVQKGTIEEQVKYLTNRVISIEKSVNKILEKMEMFMTRCDDTQSDNIIYESNESDIEEEEIVPIRLLSSRR